MQQATDKPVTDDRVMAVPAGLPQTGGADRLALFFGARLDRPGRAALGYPPEYFRWLTRITGGASYLDAALIGDVNSRGATGEARIGGTGRLTGPSASRPLLGAAITRPLTLAIWSNMKLRAALRETVAENERQHSTKGWVRHLTRARDAELADALARLLPENHYSLRAAIVEFLDADPPATPLAASDSPEGDAPEDGDEGGSSSSRQGGGRPTDRRQLLLDVLLAEARAAGIDYLLRWADTSAGTQLLEVNPLPGEAIAEAVLDQLAPSDSGLLRLYNRPRAARQALSRWTVGKRAELRLALEWGRRLPGAVRRLWHQRGRPVEPTPAAADIARPTTARRQPSAVGQPTATLAGARAPALADARTIDDIELRCLGGPALPVTEELLARIRDLLANAQDSFGIFPTYTEADLTRLLTPARPEVSLGRYFVSHRQAGPAILNVGPGHDVLSFVALRYPSGGSAGIGQTPSAEGAELLGLVFGHRLPYFAGPAKQHYRREGGERAEEVWTIRASYFAAGVGPFRQADLLQRAVEAAANRYGIGRVLYLRRAGLAERFLSRTVLGARRLPDRLALHYIPLSERALAEEAILTRSLPVNFI